MAKFTSILVFLCLSWICSLETSAGRSQEDSDRLMKVITTLFDDDELTDVRDIHSKKQKSSDFTGVHTGNKHSSGSDVRNADKSNAGDIQRMLDTKDVSEENIMLLKELEAFLSSKRQIRKKSKKWIVQDIPGRATSTTSTSTTPPPTMAPTTTTAAPVRMCTIRIRHWWSWRVKYVRRPC